MKILPLAFIMFLISCSLSPKPLYKSDETCVSFFKYIKGNWKKNIHGYYEFDGQPDKKTINDTFNIRSNKCLVGMTRKGIEELLGQPTREYYAYGDLLHIEYHMNQNCKVNTSGCMRLKMLINMKTNIVEMVFPIIKERTFK
ncbi:MAG: hypothetical protein IT260_11610 [Saprospiraceae bacterium]|nr:hypothetical protein [Saprospiraceae bacterium]